MAPESTEERLAKLEEKVQALSAEVTDDRLLKREALRDVETRLRHLEKALYIGFGLVMALQLFLGVE